MPNNIPQALQYFTQYLQQENARLDKEDKEQNINLAISQTASKFKELGPNATQEDARNLLFETIRIAAENDAPETIPFIQGVYGDTANYIERQKVLKQSDYLGDLIEKNFGIPQGNLTGEQLASYAQLLASMTKPVQQTFEDEKTPGRYTSYLTNMQWNAGGWKQIGEKLYTGVVDKNEDFNYQLKLIKAQSQYTRPAGIQQAPLETSMGYNLIFNPNVRGNANPWTVVVGGVQVPWDPEKHGAMDTRESESLKIQRGFHLTEKTEEATFKQVQLQGKVLAATFSKYPIPQNLKDILIDLDARGETTSHAAQKIIDIYNAGQIDQLLAVIPPGADRDLAEYEVQQLKEKIIPYNAANAELLSTLGVGVSDLNSNMSAIQYSTWTKHIEEILGDPNTHAQGFININKVLLLLKVKRGLGQGEMSTPTELRSLDDWAKLNPQLQATIVEALYLQGGK